MARSSPRGFQRSGNQSNGVSCPPGLTAHIIPADAHCDHQRCDRSRALPGNRVAIHVDRGEGASSGGDAFPYYFKKVGLGPLIGTRTWGGLIGISGNPALVDGGNISAPRFRFLDTEGQWAVEGEGVAPDVEVVDRPDLVAKGQDPSLERAVAWLLSEMQKSPRKPIRVPPPPRG
jgi:C-terminal processing protease CtpA/Prc